MRLRRAASLVTVLVAVAGVGGAGCGDRHVDHESLGTTTSTPSRPSSTLPRPSTIAAAPNTPNTPSDMPSSLETASFDDPVPHPEHSPLDPHAPVSLRVLGTLSLPTIGLSTPLREGVELTVIDQGPGHWAGTAMPGERGNVVVAGHRVTHSHPFLDLDQLHPGDPIVFVTEAGTFTYRIRDTVIVSPADVWVVDQHPANEVTLIACHPKHSAAQRIVVQGTLVRSTLTAAGRADARRLAAGLAHIAP